MSNVTKLNTHGGVRPGAGRPPKALKYADQSDAIDQRIVDALPEIIDAAIALAKQGNVAAMRFLTDRIFGRVRSADPISRDTTLPYTQQDFEFDLTHKKNRAKLGHTTKSVPSPISIADEIAQHFRRNDGPNALDELAALLGPDKKERNVFAMAR